jgi:hypothetical protein
MEWNRTETLALAAYNCTHCHGVGSLPSKSGGITPCTCVYRGIFRVCYDRFRNCVERERSMSSVSLETTQSSRRYSYGRKEEEYIADFYLVSKRHLSSEEYRIFNYRFLLGADWKLCCRKLKMDRGTFFHFVYRIQQKLGRIFKELKPFALFPLDEYFTTGGRSEALEVTMATRVENKVIEFARARANRPVEPPIRKVA